MNWPKSTFFGLVILIALCLIVRVAILATSDPILWPDSGAYLNLAYAFKTLDFSLDNGARAPAYSLFLLLVGSAPGKAAAIQAILGLMITSSIYWITWRTTANNLIAILAGASYGLNIAQIQFENSILSETLSTFFIVMSVTLLFLAWEKEGEDQILGWRLYMLYTGMGLAGALAALTRPGFVFLPFLLFAFSTIKLVQVGQKITPAALSLAPAIILLGGWMAFNQVRFGYFGLSTVTGYGLSDLSGAFIEYAPDEYKQIRDIYLKYRPQQIQVFGVPIGTSLLALDETQNATGLSYSELSSTYAKLSILLIREHPTDYFDIVKISWNNYWKAPDLYPWANIRTGALSFYKLIDNIWAQTGFIGAIASTFFLLLCLIGVIILVALRLRHLRNNLLTITFGTISITAALLHTMLVFGVPRYQLPTQPLVACMVASSLLSLFRYFRLVRPAAHRSPDQ